MDRRKGKKGREEERGAELRKDGERRDVAEGNTNRSSRSQDFDLVMVLTFRFRYKGGWRWAVPPVVRSWVQIPLWMWSTDVQRRA